LQNKIIFIDQHVSIGNFYFYSEQESGIMKYEKKLKELQKQQQERFKPLKLQYPTVSPRGQKIERKSFITLTSNVRNTNRNDF